VGLLTAASIRGIRRCDGDSRRIEPEDARNSRTLEGELHKMKKSPWDREDCDLSAKIAELVKIYKAKVNKSSKKAFAADPHDPLWSDTTPSSSLERQARGRPYRNIEAFPPTRAQPLTSLMVFGNMAKIPHRRRLHS
jgi:hypothetical protein